MGNTTIKTKKKGIKKIPLQERKANPRSNYWFRKANQAWRDDVVEQFGGACAVCGREHGKLDAHHILSKGRNNAFRHYPENGILLCVHCHKWGATFSAHGTPAAFKAWLEIHHPKKFEWMIEHKGKTQKSNYKEAFEKLTKGEQ